MRVRPCGPGLLYHAGALGDFVLSLPAIQRVWQATRVSEWRYWGPPERLLLLPGFLGAPAALLRSGHSLWGNAPDAAAVSWLRASSCVLAFGGGTAPAWAPDRCASWIGVSAFPAHGGCWVPCHQARQLAARGIPRVHRAWLPRWRASVLPARRPARIVVHPGSGSPGKNLPLDTWQGAIVRLRGETGLPAAVVLGPVEAESGLGPPALSRIGEVVVCHGLADLLDVLGSTALFLGNDSGPTHLAAALGVPTVSAFGPSDPGIWRPLGPAVHVLTPSVPCAPCCGAGRMACPSPQCLEAIEAGTVARAGLALLQATQGRRGGFEVA